GSAPQGSDHSSADRDRTRPDTIIVGAGLAGLVAAHELTRAGRRVLVIDQENRANLGGQAFRSLGGLFLIATPDQRRLGIRVPLAAGHDLTRAGRRVLVIDQENRANLGGQAFWSLGGLFLIGSPEQRRLGVRDSLELASADWATSAGFDRDEDRWPRAWAEAYLGFAAGEKRQYLRDLGLRVTPIVGWAERGGSGAGEHGNSVPRFHLTWGTGPEVVRVFREPVEAAEAAGLVHFAFRHRVDELSTEDGGVVGVRGRVRAASHTGRGVASHREEVADFELRAPAVIVTSGGIGHNFELMEKHWPTERLGRFPDRMLAGVPA